ncbi:hypothetical protein, partial [Acinetobacter baumannii]|uniref:hypothetical protein n=1 Tax=Acinetobacter baumannii TaxID=470 RepID=UPI001C0998AA
GKAIVHLDIVAEEFGRTVDPRVRLWSDARAGIEALGEALADQAGAIKARLGEYGADVARRMAEWREATRERYLSE